MIPLLMYVIFAVLPSLSTVMYSFTNKTGVPGIKWNFIGFNNYKRYFSSSDVSEHWRAIKNSIIFAVLVTVFQNAWALFVAMLLNQKLKGSIFYRAVFFLPVVLGVVVAGLVWKMILNPVFGPTASLFQWMGLQTVNFFSSYTISLYSIIFVQIWMYMGYSMVIFLAGLQAIPSDLYEAGYIDGTNQWQSFRRITFPLIAPAFTVNILLSMIGSLQTFDIIYVLTNARFHTNTLAIDVYNAAFSDTMDQGFASATAMIQFVLILVVVVVTQYYLRKREVEM